MSTLVNSSIVYVVRRSLSKYWSCTYKEDHVHLVLSIPPKYSVSSFMGYLKGKMSLGLFTRYEQLGKRYWGRHLWSRGYCVSTVGLDEEQVRKYVKYQERKDRDSEQGKLDLE